MKKAFSSQFGKQFGKFGKANFFSKDSSTNSVGHLKTQGICKGILNKKL